MPQDNEFEQLNEDEVVSFGRYFARELRRVGIPWTMNVLDDYYNTKKSYWITGDQNISNAILDMDRVLEEIRKVM